MQEKYFAVYFVVAAAMLGLPGLWWALVWWPWVFAGPDTPVGGYVFAFGPLGLAVVLLGFAIFEGKRR